MENKIKGMFYGLAIGDALGAPHELRNQKKENYTGLLEIVPKFVGRFSSKTLSIGQYTDDTIMTLALLNSILKNKKFIKNEAILSYQEFTRATSQLGKNTRELLYGVKTVKGYESRFNKKFENQEKKDSMLSNGALMRCSPLVFSSDKDIIEDCYITNPNKLCSDCNLFYLKLLKFILEDDDQNQEKINKKINSLLKEINNDLITKIIQETDKKEISSELKNKIKGKEKGYVLYPLFCSIWSLKHYSSFESGIDSIIKLQGDCDTNGAISGVLLGAYFGFENMQKEEKTNYNINIINNLTFEDSDIKLPDKFTLKNIDQQINELIKLKLN